MKIIIFENCAQSVVLSKLKAACEKLNSTYYFSEFSYCPTLFSYVDDKGILQIGNRNDGAIESLKKRDDITLIETSTLEEFIKETYLLKYRIDAKLDAPNALF